MNADEQALEELLNWDQPTLRSPFRAWDAPSSDFQRTYTVQELPDTKFGGTYIRCNCPGWGRMFGVGRTCKHVQMIAAREGLTWEQITRRP